MGRPVLAEHQYGKQGVRLVHVNRSTEPHAVADLAVDVTLAGDIGDSYTTGDNAKVIATDTQKNTVYAFARMHGVNPLEGFAVHLAEHFVADHPAISQARVGLVSHAWRPLSDRNSFYRAATERRTVSVASSGDQTWVVAGIDELTLLKTTGSEFRGYPRDRYTTLAETDDRLLATKARARWRYDPAAPTADWDGMFTLARTAIADAFAETYSHSLQETLHAMACRVLDACPEVVEVRLSLPNIHHLLVDLAPFDLDNPAQVYVATQEPYGLIEGAVSREAAPPPGLAWW